jgi:nucleoside-diphosphate-sugar epimerase
MKTKILITGGSGFIGTHLVDAFHMDDYEVLNLDVQTPKLKAHEALWKRVDICDHNLVEQTILDFSPELVLHMAARTDLRGKTLKDYAANTEGVSNLLSVLDKLPNLKKVIFASSMYVTEPGYVPSDFDDYAPHTVYGESKVMTEKIIKDKNPTYTWSIIRPTSIWGPYFGEPYDLFFKIVLSKKYFHLGEKACKKTYGFVSNAVFQIRTILDSDKKNVDKKVFYLGDYTPYDISEWADEIAEYAKISIPTIPFFFFRVAGLFGDGLKLLGIKFPMTSFRLKNMTTDNIHDLSLIKDLAPNLPINRKDGTRQTVDWIKNS